LHDPDVFPNNDAVFQDDDSSIHADIPVQSWFEEHESAFRHFPWPAHTPDLSITEPLWSVLETGVRNRFPPPTYLKQLEDVPQEEWCTIPLWTVENLYESIPKRIAAVLIENTGSTPY
jgi:hypothetical protein